MATAAKIGIAIEAQTATLQKGFGQAKAAIKDLDANMSRNVAGGMAAFTIGLAAVKGALATVRGGIAEVMGAMASMDREAKFAARLGANADQLTALGLAAQKAGSSTETMNNALEKMQNQIGEAAAGAKGSIEAFARLGLSVDDLKGKSADQAFAAIAEQIQQLGDDTAATKIALDIFGRSGGELLPLLKGGAEGLNEMGAEAGRLGLLLGDARGGVEAANDAITSMKRAWGGLVQQVAIAVAPALKAVAELLAAIVGGFNRLLGRGTGATGTFATFASEGKKAAISVEKSLEKTEKTAKKAADKIKDSFTKIPSPKDWDTPAVGVANRATSEGFSAVQDAQRRQRDNERRWRDLMTQLAQIYAAQSKSVITVAPVNI